MKMSDVFYGELGEVPHNPSFEVQDCLFVSYGQQYDSTAEQDEAIQHAVLNHDALTERVKELAELLSQSRDFIAADKNCGPCGLGLICMIDDALDKANEQS